ncbi:hypothetical protein FRX31_017774 [Thalictrum thalictroides]|uniref:RNase H type-1 domain-containing protein n=1 Tax=Thalictrum thalictroides TaxID=46969 RepID=A0A7J6W5I9_THATH|nr:hypothetical protein FRX31_017774 [Thalictrum thalictroides]
MAEFMALALGLKVLAKFRHNSIILEMDSQLLHKAITGGVEDLHWTLAEILFDIKNSLAEFPDVRIVWNYREVNQCADVLAGYASKMASSSTWFTSPYGQLTEWPTHMVDVLPSFCFAWWHCQPSFLRDVISKDMLGISSCRLVH